MNNETMENAKGTLREKVKEQIKEQIENTMKNQKKEGLAGNGKGIIAGVALILFLVTLKVGIGRGTLALAANLVFLVIMLAVIYSSFVRSLDPMRATAEDLETQLQTVMERYHYRMDGIRSSDPDFSQRVTWFWEELQKETLSFRDASVKERWDRYLQTGIGNEAILYSEDELMDRYDASYADMVTQTLTNLGMVGTFMGVLICVLNFSMQDLDLSIGNLMSGMGVAFLSSIYNLVFSSVYNYINWNIQNRLCNDINRLRDTLGGLFIGTAGDTALDQILHIQEANKTELAAIRTGISGNFGNDVGKKVGKEITPALENVCHSLNEVITKFNLEQLNALEKITNTFLQGVTNGLDRHINRLGASVDRLSTSQDTMNREMRQFLGQLETSLSNVESVNRTSGDLNTQLQSYLEKINTMAAASGTIVTEVSSYSKVITESFEKQTEIMDAMKTMASGTETITADLKKTQRELNKTVKELQNNSTAMLELANQMKLSQERSDTQYQKLMGLMEEETRNLKKGTGRISEGESSEDDRMERLIRALEENNRMMMDRPMNRLSRGIDRLIRKMGSGEKVL